MPYIFANDRDDLDFTNLQDIAQTPGELNFQITRIIDMYIQEKGLSYNEGINAAVGALECCKLEFYRRVATPYEDQKCRENGDVYTVVPKNPLTMYSETLKVDNVQWMSVSNPDNWIYLGSKN